MDKQDKQNPDLVMPLIFSVGHSNHPLPFFLNLLSSHRVEVLVDVRSYPYSSYTTHFNGPELKTAVTEHGLKYLFMGKELGGRPDGPEYYDAKGRVLYGQVALSHLFLEGVVRLEKGLEKYRVAMMCSEEDPTGCHRHLLISRVLAERGINIWHIRGDGTLQSEEALSSQQASDALQMSLFPQDEEQAQWKSLRSVSPKKARPNSSQP